MRFALVSGLILLFSVTGSAAPAANRTQPVSIAFWNARHGLLAKLDWASCGAHFHCRGSIELTTDGGLTWRMTWRGNVVRNVSVVAGTGQAWATVEPGHTCGTRLLSPCPTRLLRSTDGGRTWSESKTIVEVPSTPLPLAAYAFRSGRTWQFRRTTNDGRTWAAVRGPCPHAAGVAPSFVSRRHGWVVCASQPAAGSQPKAVYETSDGARRWRLVSGLDGSGYASGLSFSRSGHGLLWELRGNTYRTVNGGRSWQAVSVTSPETREGVAGCFVDEHLGFLVLQDEGDSRYELLRTNDSGATWMLVRTWPRA